MQILFDVLVDELPQKYCGRLDIDKDHGQIKYEQIYRLVYNLTRDYKTVKAKYPKNSASRVFHAQDDELSMSILNPVQKT